MKNTGTIRMRLMGVLLIILILVINAQEKPIVVQVDSVVRKADTLYLDQIMQMNKLDSLIEAKKKKL